MAITYNHLVTLSWQDVSLWARNALPRQALTTALRIGDPRSDPLSLVREFPMLRVRGAAIEACQGGRLVCIGGQTMDQARHLQNVPDGSGGVEDFEAAAVPL